MRTRPLTMWGCLLAASLFGSAPAAEAPPPGFTRKPTAARAGDKVKIEFAADRETDAAVFIEDAKGKVVRHLVAGALGTNPPAPLKPGLSQSIEWDGKADYGRPAGNGPFRVRVALGLGAKFDRELLSDRQNLGAVSALCAGPDGTLYVFNSFGASVPNWGTYHLLQAFGRDGKYQRTVLPPPPDTAAGEWAALESRAVTAGGRVCPMFVSLQSRRLTGINLERKGAAAATPDGKILVLGPAIGAITPEGKAAWGKLHGPKLLPAVERLDVSHHGRIAVSPDGKHAYLTGLQDRGKAFPAVYRVKLPERGPAEPFFGNPAQAGNDEQHLSADVRGLAVDGKGHVLVADRGNGRVVAVGEEDGKFAGSFPVPEPHDVAVDAATGAVYVTGLSKGNAGALIKLSSWKEAKELARMAVKPHGNPDCPWSMALDASAKPPIVWLGSDGGSLLRVEDAGGKLSGGAVDSKAIGNGAFVGIEVDRFREDPEIYVRCGRFPVTWYRYNEREDKLSKFAVPEGTSCVVPGPDGLLYSAAWPYHLERLDRSGKPSPWQQATYPDEVISKGQTTKIDAKQRKAAGLYLPVSMTFMTHTVGVRSDGHIFAFDPGQPGNRPAKVLIEILPSGERVKRDPIIWGVSDTAVGPKFDPAGNIYVAEQVKPAGEPVPPEFAEAVGPVKAEAMVKGDLAVTVCTIYGSILKFPPGGGVLRGGWDTGEITKTFGEPKPPDPGSRTLDALAYHQGGRFKAVKVTGAEWMRLGVSHVDLVYCNCENTRFDVDEFGRVWYPDLGRFRVGVLDTNGNEITGFGGYGTLECAGPGSKRPDPDIAFAWLIGVGATDKYAYMGDSMNRRLLRAKLVYAAEETCPLP